MKKENSHGIFNCGDALSARISADARLRAVYAISSIAARAQEKRKNDASPRLTVPASVVTKRAQVGTTHHHNAATNTGGTYYNTKYFATFQFESGDRLELSVSPGEYGMLVEGDRGQLSFQGTRYLGFVRQ